MSFEHIMRHFHQQITHIKESAQLTDSVYVIHAPHAMNTRTRYRGIYTWNFFMILISKIRYMKAKQNI